MQFLPRVFDKRLFLYLFFGFVIAVIAGTLSHECGRLIMARYWGFKNGHIRYAYTVYGECAEKWHERDSLLLQHLDEYNGGLDFPHKDEFRKLANAATRDQSLLTAAGPLETICTGALGLLLLFLFRKQFANKEQLSFIQWFMVFLSLFWLREIFNLLIAILFSLTARLKTRSDEFSLARNLDWNYGAFL